MVAQDHFIGDPNKPEYVDEDDVEAYFSEDDVFFVNPDDPEYENQQFLIDGLEIEDDEDDSDYDPADEFGGFITDSDDESWEDFEGVIVEDEEVEDDDDVTSDDESNMEETKKPVETSKTGEVENNSPNIQPSEGDATI